MSLLHLPWLEFSILIPLVGAVAVARVRDPDEARRQSILIKAFVLVCAAGAWLDFGRLHVFAAHDRWDVVSAIFGRELISIDELSAPLLPLAALLYLATALATLPTKVKRYSFAGSLASEAIVLATFSCRTPWMVVALLAAGTVPPWLELRSRRSPTRMYVLHMGLFVSLLIAGQGLISSAPPSTDRAAIGVALLATAVLIRSGVFPLHLW
ncbi:MAG: oxidoreductase, partial [Planctomycetaceae bacterium]|nr:oxidoreductase [Planctomycetaceae bacterium]